jgi:hypothetical protein
MTNDSRGSAGRPVEKLREIPQWTERYARNRTLPTIVVLAIVAVSVAPLGPLVYMIEQSQRAGATARAIVLLLLSAAVLTWLLWLGFAGGQRLVLRIADRLYVREGEVLTEPMAQARSRDPRSSPASFLYLFCVLVWSGLWWLKVIPNRLWVPALAVFLVPYLYYVFLVRMRGAVSPFLLAWPALYGIHALLLALGAPIYIRGGAGGVYETLNFLIPVLGYGLVCALVGHLYSRFALRHLRAIARSPEAVEESK